MARALDLAYMYSLIFQWFGHGAEDDAPELSD
jgi:hypothetical protein